jgi:hypothetical protein
MAIKDSSSEVERCLLRAKVPISARSWTGTS